MLAVYNELYWLPTIPDFTVKAAANLSPQNIKISCVIYYHLEAFQYYCFDLIHIVELSIA